LKTPEILFLIAGNGNYPALVIAEARAAGVKKIAMAAFEGETPDSTAALADTVHWMKVGQLGRMLDAARKSGATAAIMAGQIAPNNLFNLRPDLKALVLLAQLKRRNAETLFGEIANQLSKVGVELLLATTFLDQHLAAPGLIAGPKLKPREIEDLEFGFHIAKESSRLDIGQTVVVKKGTVLAVEAFEGTDECIRRGGALGRGKAIMVKVTKPAQDMRFDVPVVGLKTIQTATEAGLRAIGVEAGQTLLLNLPEVSAAAGRAGISIYGLTK